MPQPIQGGCVHKTINQPGACCGQRPNVDVFQHISTRSFWILAVVLVINYLFIKAKLEPVNKGDAPVDPTPLTSEVTTNDPDPLMSLIKAPSEKQAASEPSVDAPDTSLTAPTVTPERLAETERILTLGIAAIMLALQVVQGRRLFITAWRFTSHGFRSHRENAPWLALMWYVVWTGIAIVLWVGMLSFGAIIIGKQFTWMQHVYGLRPSQGASHLGSKDVKSPESQPAQEKPKEEAQCGEKRALMEV